MIRAILRSEKFRFLIVGVWNSAFSYILFAALLFALEPSSPPSAASGWTAWWAAHYYLTAQWVSWALAVPQSTLTFKYLVFHSRGHALREVGRGYLVYAPLQLVSSGLLWLFSGVMHLHPLIGQLLTAGVIAVLSYVGHKNFTFKTVAEPVTEPPSEADAPVG